MEPANPLGFLDHWELQYSGTGLQLHWSLGFHVLVILFPTPPFWNGKGDGYHVFTSLQQQYPCFVQLFAQHSQTVLKGPFGNNPFGAVLH